MSEIKVDKISPQSGTELEIGDSGDTIDLSAVTVTLPANSVNSDQYVDGSIDTIHIGNDQVTGAKLNPSLVAGDVIYADGTDTINRLAKGTAAQVLSMNAGATAPEWATPAAGGTSGWHLLDTEVVTGTPTDVRFESNIDATYRNYAVVWTDVHPSVNMTTFTMRYGYNQTYHTVGYDWDTHWSTNNTNGTQSGFSSNNIRLSNDVGSDRTNNVEEGSSGIVYIFNIFDSTKCTKAMWQCQSLDGTSKLFSTTGQSTTKVGPYSYSTQAGNITSYNNIYFAPGSGTLAGGRFKLYGLAD